VAELVRHLSLAQFDDGRGYLLEASRIPELLVAVRTFALGKERSVYIRRDGAPPEVLGRNSVLTTLYPRLRGARRLMLWCRDGERSESLVIEILSSPLGFYRNRAPRALARDVPKASSGELFSSYAQRWSNSTLQFQEPVHVVFTWVNSRDPKFRELLRPYSLPQSQDLDEDRYRESGELRFALRSVHYNLPWVQRIFVVSNCARPAWLNEAQVSWVDHAQILPGHALPTFNSHVIEAALHRISGLAEHFIYFNDDMFVNEACDAGQFFTSKGHSLAQLESFGSVDAYTPSTIPTDQIWQFAARNGAELLERRFGKRPTQHHKHTPYALRKSVLEALVHEFASEFQLLEQQRFRSPQDLSPTSFLYHHYALALGAAEHGQATDLHVQRRNFHKLARKVLTGRAGDFLCLNDGGSRDNLEAFDAFKTEAMQRLFPLAAPWELS